MRLRRTKVRYRRRYLIPIVVMMIVPILIVWSNVLNRDGPSNQGHIASLPSPFCRKGDPLAGVNPLRFRLLSNCEIGSGVVNSIISQADGSTWINLAVNSQFSRLLDPGNINHQGGLLVLEQLIGDNVTGLSIGEAISFVGPLVYDTENQFNAICPVWSLTPS